MIITISGASNSGKSYISNIIKELEKNTIHINIDTIAHMALENKKIKNKLIKIFSLKNTNKIDRKELGNIVFNDTYKMELLSEITWNYMENYIDNIIANNKDKIIILDYILIPKTKYFKMSNINILVKANKETRLNRSIKRDNITEKKFIERDNNCPIYNEEEFDYIIDNNQKEETRKMVKQIYDKSIIYRKF